MPIIVDIDVMLARCKMAGGALAERVGITPASLAVLKNGRAKAVRFTTLAALRKVLACRPGDVLRRERDGDERPLAVYNEGRVHLKRSMFSPVDQHAPDRLRSVLVTSASP